MQSQRQLAPFGTDARKGIQLLGIAVGDCTLSQIEAYGRSKCGHGVTYFAIEVRDKFAEPPVIIVITGSKNLGSSAFPRGTLAQSKRPIATLDMMRACPCGQLLRSRRVLDQVAHLAGMRSRRQNLSAVFAGSLPALGLCELRLLTLANWCMQRNVLTSKGGRAGESVFSNSIIIPRQVLEHGGHAAC